ncbi:MAG: potassium channel family protein [Solirubrobacterales bacterium]
MGDPQQTKHKLTQQERFARRVEKAIASRRIFWYLAGVTFAMALVAGFVETLVDHEEFQNFGQGVWWAIVTLATVGYGDFVPKTTAGRAVGAVVIVIGVTFLTFLTATVTSLFVSSDQKEATAKQISAAREHAEATTETLARIEQRLDAIEEQLKK